VRVNGSEWDGKVRRGTFVELKREWKPEDRVELDLEFSPTIVSANPLVEECVGQVAVKRGPLIYCVESHDIPKPGPIHAVHLKASHPWTTIPGDGVLQGIRLLQGTVLMDESMPITPPNLYKEYQPPIFQRAEIKMIPYFAWGNRGTSEMSVWNKVQP
ncbi:MAG: glycoside hydrolase family 127 protein, partial [Planctomycetes bacterium]|nr:glycoside hydrolase family 127 protein [Planctomycetota bacterium]